MIDFFLLKIGILLFLAKSKYCLDNSGYWMVKKNFKIDKISNMTSSFKISNKYECMNKCGLDCNSIEIKDQICKIYFGDMSEYYIPDQDSVVFLKIKVPLLINNVIIAYNNSNLTNGLVRASNNGMLCSSWDSQIKFLLPTFNSIKNHTKTISSMVFLSNGDLITASEDSTIKVWDTENFTLKKTLTFHNSSIRLLFIISNGNFISIDSVGRVVEWNINTYTSFLLGNSSGISVLTNLHNGDLALSLNDSTIYIYSSKFQNLKTNFSNHSKKISSLITLSNGDLASGSLDGSVIIWDMVNMMMKKTLFKFPCPIDLIYQFRKEYLIVACNYFHGHITFWNFEGLNLLTLLSYHYSPITSLFVLNDTKLITASKDDFIKISNLSIS